MPLNRLSAGDLDRLIAKNRPTQSLHITDGSGVEVIKGPEKAFPASGGAIGFKSDVSARFTFDKDRNPLVHFGSDTSKVEIKVPFTALHPASRQRLVKPHWKSNPWYGGPATSAFDGPALISGEKIRMTSAEFAFAPSPQFSIYDAPTVKFKKFIAQLVNVENGEVLFSFYFRRGSKSITEAYEASVTKSKDGIIMTEPVSK